MKQEIYGALIFIVSLVVFLILLGLGGEKNTTHGLGYWRSLAPIFWTAGVLYLGLGFALHFGLK